MNQTQKSMRGIISLLLAAFIWGIAFVAQSKGGDALGPYTFNASRFLLGGFVLMPLCAFFRTRQGNAVQRPLPIKSGVIIGISLAIASNLQQVGITMGASVGKAGFLTACYIILVPIIGILFGKKCPPRIWLAVAIALAGLYLLCMTGSLSPERPDLLLLLCALFFTFQIIMISRFAAEESAVELSCIEFFTCGILSMVPSLALEVIPNPIGVLSAFMTLDAWLPILFAGIFSTGIAYTLQIVGQAYVHPTIASLIMSMESVFSVLAGWLLLGERLSLREKSGCALIFIAVIIAQIEPIKKDNE